MLDLLPDWHWYWLIAIGSAIVIYPILVFIVTLFHEELNLKLDDKNFEETLPGALLITAFFTTVGCLVWPLSFLTLVPGSVGYGAFCVKRSIKARRADKQRQEEEVQRRVEKILSAEYYKDKIANNKEIACSHKEPEKTCFSCFVNS